MKYAILIHQTDAEMAKKDDPKQVAAYHAAWAAYSEAIFGSGVAYGGAGLELPHTATTVRIEKGERRVQDGPFADTKEKLGGFYLIDVPTLDKAVEWAAKCPAADKGSIEIRPVMPMIDTKK